MNYSYNGWPFSARYFRVCLFELCILSSLINGFSVFTTSTSSRSLSLGDSPEFMQTVTRWLEAEKIEWQKVEKHELFPKSMKIDAQPILQVGTNCDALYLHILRTPTSKADCISPICTRDMTNYVQYLNQKKRQQQKTIEMAQNITGKISLIHLHEDVWTNKLEIVQSRLKIRLGRGQSRIFARKTKVRRINMMTAVPFLQDNHLWSATKARYYYGLFHPPDTEDGKEILVAVATFGSRRNIAYGIEKRKTYELIRFCSRKGMIVVGGISKLLRAFVKDQNGTVDDIITVVDRDWGPGDGWHSIGFQTMHVMGPVTMPIKDGIRRYLVGANINVKNNHDAGLKEKSVQAGRPGLENYVLEELDSLNTHFEGLNCLEKHGFYPVYDAGVERLLFTIPQEQKNGSMSSKIPNLWRTSVSSYAATYRSNSKGITCIMNHIMSFTISSSYGRPLSEIASSVGSSDDNNDMNDSKEAKEHTAAWKATGGTARNATTVYSIPSSMDPNAFVEVRERLGGWCTLGIVGGATKSIYHGNFFSSRSSMGHRMIDSSVMVSEYLRSMASVAMTGLQYRKGHPDIISVPAMTNGTLSFLYLGFGAGSLPRFMSNAIPGSRHVAIELDDAVIQTAYDCGLVPDDIQLIQGDALTYQNSVNDTEGRHGQQQQPFDVVFIDVFDGENLLPEAFYNKEYLKHVQKNFLGGRTDGLVIHNFHTGGKKLSAQLQDAVKGYRSTFATTLLVESIDSRHTGGNTILLATNQRRLDASSETLSWHKAARDANANMSVSFDVHSRSTHKLWFS